MCLKYIGYYDPGRCPHKIHVKVLPILSDKLLLLNPLKLCLCLFLGDVVSLSPIVFYVIA